VLKPTIDAETNVTSRENDADDDQAIGGARGEIQTSGSFGTGGNAANGGDAPGSARTVHLTD